MGGDTRVFTLMPSITAAVSQFLFLLAEYDEDNVAGFCCISRVGGPSLRGGRPRPDLADDRFLSSCRTELGTMRMGLGGLEVSPPAPPAMQPPPSLPSLSVLY